MKRKMLVTLLCVSLTAGMLAGCGSAGQEAPAAPVEEAAEEAPAEEEPAQETPAEEAPAAETYNIGYCNQQMKFFFIDTAATEIYTAATNAGYEYNLAITDRDSTKMVTSIETLVTKGADIIVDFNCLPEQGAAAGEKLAAEGIPMLSVDSDYGEGVYFFGVNNYDAGTQLGKSLETFVDDRFGGEVDFVVALWDSQAGDVVKMRCEGATDEIQEKYGLSDDQVVWLDSMADDTKTQSMTRDWLDAHPEAEHIVFVGQNDDRGYAINQAVIAADRVANCLIGSHNADPSSVENLQKNMDDPTATAWVTTMAYNSFLYGEQIVAYVADIMAGGAEMQRYAEISPLTTENVNDYIAERDEVQANFIEH